MISSMAGADSTTSTMQSFLHFVLSSQCIFEKLMTEITRSTSSENLSYPHCTYDEVQDLSYFQACLKETMRLRPAFGIAMERQIVNSDGAVLEGKWYPQGTKVAVNSWVVHRDKDIFGDDAEIFRPERWLENKERSKVMDRHMVHVSSCTPASVPRVQSANSAALFAVRRWLSYLHWPKSRLTRAEQSPSHPSPRIRHPAR